MRLTVAAILTSRRIDDIKEIRLNSEQTYELNVDGEDFAGGSNKADCGSAWQSNNNVVTADGDDERRETTRGATSGIPMESKRSS